MPGKIKYGLGLVVMITACSAKTDVVLENEPVAVSEVTALPYFNSPDFDPVWEANSEPVHHVKAFEFTNHRGKKVNQESVKGKVILTNFFFTTCGGICPKMMQNMEYVQHQLAGHEEVVFLSHSVLPETDSVAQLATYSNNFDVGERWHLLTGDKSEIYEMARKAYFVKEEPGFNKAKTEFLHSEHFVLVDGNQRIRGIYNGTVRLEMDRIIEDILLLLKEKV